MKQMTHGGNLREFPDFLDFSANINPLGMPEQVRRAAIESSREWERYPDPECTDLRRKIANKLGVPFSNIVCGNGADDLIYRIICTVRPKKAVIAVPTFGEYYKSLNESGCDVQEFVLSEDLGFKLEEDFLQEITPSTEMVILCSPNNPTGTTVSESILKKCAERCNEFGTILLCDESFMGFVPESQRHSILAHFSGNCIMLSSLTKLYAIPGLRVGYAVFSDKKLASSVHARGQFWAVSSPALAAGCAALDCGDFEVRTVEYIARERDYLAMGLSEMGFTVFPSDANFLLIKSDMPLDDMLLNSKILIRNCGSFSGLGNHYFRIAVRSHTDNQKFLNAVRRCLNG